MCIMWLKMIQEATGEKCGDTKWAGPTPKAAGKCLPEKGCLSTPCGLPSPENQS